MARVKCVSLSCKSYLTLILSIRFSQQVFYNEDDAQMVKLRFSKPKIPFLTRGSTFRCPTIRVMRQLKMDTTPAREVEQYEFTRYSLPRQKPRLNESIDNNYIKPPIEPPLIPVPSITIETSSIHMNDDVNTDEIEVRVSSSKCQASI